MAKKEIKSDSIVLKPQALPTVGVDGEVRVDSADYKLKKYNGVFGLWEEISGAGGGTGKNYITNPDFEINSTDDWGLFTTSLTSGKPTGSITGGAASITTFATTATNKLAGDYSMVTASSGAWSAGQGIITDAFAIDLGDRGKVLRLSMDVYANSGASNINASGTTNNSFGFWIYDVTNSQWVEMVGTYAMNKTSGPLMAEVQLPTTCASARVAILCVNATSGACSLNWDSFVFGPREVAKGAVMTDWVSYTPTFNNVSGGTATGFYRRVGDTLETYARYTFGATAPSGTVTLNTPSGMVIDSNKTTVDTKNMELGKAYFFDASANFGFHSAVQMNSTTAVRPLNWLISGSRVDDQVFNGTTPVIAATGDILSIHYTAPITGWTSNAIMSSDFGGRKISASASTITGSHTSSGGLQAITSWTEVTDDTSSFEPSTGTYTFPESGDYVLELSVIFAGSVAGSSREAVLTINGTDYYGTGSTGSVARDALNRTSVYVQYRATAGQTAITKAYQNTGGTLNYNTALASKFNVYKLAQNQSMMGGEVVAARYYADSSSTNLSVLDVTYEVVDFNVKVYDTHNAVTTGAGWKFTAPYSGKYRITSRTLWNSLSNLLDSELSVYKIGTRDGVLGSFDVANGSIGGSITVDLTAGQYVDVRIYQNDSAGAARSIYSGGAASSHNLICIEKVN